MRGLIAGLQSPRPLAEGLPALYDRDGLARRLLEGLDEVLAPVFCVLDSFDAYLDPQLAPEDFVDWLAGWVGLALDEAVALDDRRRLVAGAVALYRRRGTLDGLGDEIELLTGVRAELEDSGAVAWSVTPRAPVPGGVEARLKVTLQAGAEGDRARVESLVAGSCPAHVMASVEVEGS